MRDKQRIFLDSNVLIYAYTNNSGDKQHKAKQLFSGYSVVVSTQVLQETANTLRRKFGADFQTIGELLKECVSNISKLHINTKETVFDACEIAEKYRFSFYDSLIVAAALESGSQLLYSEDLQHNQVIESRLKIVNPFAT
jgi:predicted nucleic acid-binding protein